MKKTRFDLETDITALYGSAEDLKTVLQMMYDSDFIYDADRTWNALYGLAEIMEAKIGKLEDTFEQVFELNNYAPEHIKQAREDVFERFKAYQDYEKEIEEKWNSFFDDLDTQEEQERSEGM